MLLTLAAVSHHRSRHRLVAHRDEMGTGKSFVYSIPVAALTISMVVVVVVHNAVVGEDEEEVDLDARIRINRGI